MSKITVNGKAQELNGSISLSELIALNKVVQPDMVSIQLNGKFVDKGTYEETIIQDNDEIDFLYFMGGGEK